MPVSELIGDADLVLGGMVHACIATNIVGRFFGWHLRRWDRRFLAHRNPKGGGDEPENPRNSNRHFGSIALTPVTIEKQGRPLLPPDWPTRIGRASMRGQTAVCDLHHMRQELLYPEQRG